MKDDRSQLSSSLSECFALSTSWRMAGYVVAVAGMLGLLVATSGSKETGKDASTTGSAEESRVNVPRVTIALHSRPDAEEAPAIKPYDPSMLLLENFATLTGESGVGSAQPWPGRCDGKSACHYSLMAEAGASEGASVNASETDAMATFRSACAAKDLNAMAQIEQLGLSDEVPSEKVAAASIKLLTARANCARGRVTEAFEQYENLLADTVASDKSK